MPTSVSVYLHEELIIGWRDHLCLQEVTRLEDGVKHENLVIIFLLQFLPFLLVLLEVIDQFA